jgi:hypothetical protein
VLAQARSPAARARRLAALGILQYDTRSTAKVRSSTSMNEKGDEASAASVMRSSARHAACLAHSWRSMHPLLLRCFGRHSSKNETKLTISRRLLVLRASVRRMQRSRARAAHWMHAAREKLRASALATRPRVAAELALCFARALFARSAPLARRSC